MIHTLGIDLGGTNLKAGIVDTQGKIVLQHSETIVGLQAPAIAQAMLSLATKMLDKAKARGLNVSAIGAGTPGVVDPKQGGVVSGCPNIPGWVGIPFMTMLHEQCHLPVAAHNDVTVMALGEQRHGAAQGLAHVVCVALGTGIGGGIIIDHNVYEGACGYAGEIGHMVIVRNGRPCPCGSRGCWEAYASTVGLLQTIEEQIWPNKKPESVKELFELATDRNTQAQKLVEDFIDLLAIGIANLINIFNPNAIVLGGGIAQAGDSIFIPLRQKIKMYGMDFAVQKAKIIPAKLGDAAGIVGAAALARG